MPHYSTLAEHRFGADVDDIRSSALYGVDKEKLGKIHDVIFDHTNGDIRYVVVDTGGWLRSKKFVVPAERIHRYDKDKDAFQVDLLKAHVERFPMYDEEAVRSETGWADYERRYQQAWHDGVVQHRHGSDHNITPTPGESRGQASVLQENEPFTGFGSLGEEIQPFSEPTTESGVESEESFTPHRLQGKFPKAAQTPEKISMRPSSAVEEGRSGMLWEDEQGGTASGALQTSREVQMERDALERRQALNRGPRWDAFAELLRKNRVDITAKCPSCKPAKDKAA